MSRKDRIQALRSAVKEYADQERKRLKQEVEILEKILKGRTGGKGIQRSSTKVVEAVAQNDLETYLKGD